MNRVDISVADVVVIVIVAADVVVAVKGVSYWSKKQLLGNKKFVLIVVKEAHTSRKTFLCDKNVIVVATAVAVKV